MGRLCNNLLACLLVGKHGMGNVNGLVLLGGNGGDHVARGAELGGVEGSSGVGMDFKGVLGLNLEEFLLDVNEAEGFAKEIFD